MKDKTPKIFKAEFNSIKSPMQKEYYCKKEEKTIVKETKKINEYDLLKKINDIFKRDDFVYQTDITIMYKNNESIKEKVIGIKDNYLITIDGKKIYISDIYDIK